MKTTLNLPDTVVKEAKQRALSEDTTLTELIIQGLRARLEKGNRNTELPQSTARGGLHPGVSWEDLEAADPEGGPYR